MTQTFMEKQIEAPREDIDIRENKLSPRIHPMVAIATHHTAIAPTVTLKTRISQIPPMTAVHDRDRPQDEDIDIPSGSDRRPTDSDRCREQICEPPVEASGSDRRKQDRDHRQP